MLSGIRLLFCIPLALSSAFAEPCLKNLDTWNQRQQQTLENPFSPFGISSYGNLLLHCENQPDQSSIFQNPDFQSSIQPIERFSRIEKFFYTDVVLTGQMSQTLTPEVSEWVKLPDLLLDSDLMEKLSREITTLSANDAYPTTNLVMSLLGDSWKLASFRNILGGKVGILYQQTAHRGIKLIHLDSGAPIGITVYDSNIYFVQYQPQGARMTAVNTNFNSCYRCHHSGVMPIMIDESNPDTKVFGQNQSFKAFQSEFNSIISQYADSRLPGGDPVDFQHVIPLGEDHPKERTDEFVDHCSKNAGITLTRESIGRVKESMNCTSCHTGESGDAGKISWGGTTSNPIEQMTTVLRESISQGIMPPRSDLSADERKALFQCLKAEYFGGFTDPSLNGDPNPGTLLRALRNNHFNRIK